MEKAERHNKEKLKWSLVDSDALVPMVQVLEFGANKYAPDNWKKGLPTLEICESLIRHLYAYMNGEDNDTESGLPHVGHIMANSMFLSYHHQFLASMDNRRTDANKQFAAYKNKIRSVDDQG